VAEASGGTDALELLNRQPDLDESEAYWEQECQRQRFLWVVQRIRDSFESSSFEAFWLTAVEGCPAKEVAARLGISVGAVYTAKSRVLDRIREEIERLGDE
jgi:RNA polymerase sigma-70 factor (ECF subfamily)